MHVVRACAACIVVLGLAAPLLAREARANDALAPGGSNQLSSAYQALWDKLQANGSLDLDLRSSLQRRIVWGSTMPDAARLSRYPTLATEKQTQEKLDEQIVDAVVSASALPIVKSPGLREALLAAAAPEPVAYFVPPRPPRALIVLLPGARETESDLASRALLQDLAQSTDTLVVVPSLDRAGTLEEVVAATTTAVDAFASAYGIDASRTYLGGVSNGAFLEFEIPLLAHRHFAAYLAIAGALPGADRAKILTTLRIHNAVAYFVAGGRSSDVATAAIRSSVSASRASGVYALYYEQTDGVDSIDSLAPAITRAWHDMLRGVDLIPSDGLGTMPPESLPGSV